MPFSWFTAALIFTLYFVFDALYAYYIKSTAAGKAVAAANSGAIMYAISAYAFKTFIDNNWYVIPLILGAWGGTYITVKYMTDKGTFNK